MRVLIVLTTARGRDLEHIDVQVTFMNGNMNEEVYIEQPRGFKIEGGKDMVCRLAKSLYGTKQASRNSNKLLHSTLERHGFKGLAAEQCIYKRGSGNKMVILLV